MTDNEKRFREVYAVKLAESMSRSPEKYRDNASTIPGLIDKMMPALANGHASIGNATRATARVLGIKPTIGEIMKFLG
jgi:hypothetical protein